MTTNNDSDFKQFKGAFDSAMSPDSDFTERMKQMLERESGEVNTQRKTTVIASPSRQESTVPAPGRRTHPLTIVASVLVVVAVVVSSIWVLSGASLEGEYGLAPSGIATLPADVATTPGPDVALSAELVIRTEDPSYSDRYILDVIDGVVYTAHAGPSTSLDQDTHAEYVTAWDADSGEKLWEIEGYSLWNLDVSDGVLVAFRLIIPPLEQRQTDEAWRPSTSLIALDASTGDELWDHTLDDDEALAFWEQQVLVVGDQVMMVDGEGLLSAMDIRTGEEIWTSTYDRGRAWPTRFEQEDETVSIDMYTVSMVEWNDEIAIANGDGRVQLFDLETGNTTASHNFELSNSEDGIPPGSLDIEEMPQGLLLFERGEQSRLTLLDPGTGESIWQREIEGDLQLKIAGNGMIAVNSHVWESGSIIMRLIGRGGHSTHQFYWVDGETGEDVLVTDRGRLDSPVFAVTNGEYLCTRTDEFVCYDRAGTKHNIEDGPWAEAFFHDGALYFDRDDGVYRVELP